MRTPAATITLARPAPSRSAIIVALLALAGATPAQACDVVPPAVRDLAVERYYSDDIGSYTDPTMLAKQREATKPVRDFLTHVIRDADASLRQKSPSLAKYRALCALDWLEAWARAGALAGHMSSKQAEAERRWSLAGAALAYLKVKPHATAEQAKAIERWLVSLADTATAAFLAGKSKRNNHWYWMGLGLGATGLAAESRRHWDLARSVMEDAARDIAADGSLPLELARGQRALHYHAFALMPLVALADLARCKGEDWESFSDNALSRLVRFTALNLDDPAEIIAKAGPQESPTSPGAGWIPLYAAMHPEWTPPAGVEMASGHRWLGGNVLLLRQMLGAIRGSDGPEPKG